MQFHDSKETSSEILLKKFLLFVRATGKFPEQPQIPRKVALQVFQVLQFLANICFSCLTLRRLTALQSFS